MGGEVTELEKEMERYIELTKGWSGNHRFKVMANWMGMSRMRDMNDHLEKLHSEQKCGEADGKRGS